MAPQPAPMSVEEAIAAKRAELAELEARMNIINDDLAILVQVRSRGLLTRSPVTRTGGDSAKVSGGRRPKNPGALMGAVLKAIHSIDGEISTKTVRAYLSENPTGADFSTAFISKALQRFKDRKVIAIVRSGEGRNPSTYQRIAS